MPQNFLVSPGINVSEFDLTTIIPSIPTTVGALGGVFRWGPVGNTTLVSSQQQMVTWFLPPTNFNAETFFTGSNFLDYSQNLQISRAGITTGNSATFTDASANVTTGNTVVNFAIATTGIGVGQLLFFCNSTALVTSPGKEYSVTSVNTTAVVLSGGALSTNVGLQMVFRDNMLYNSVAQETVNQTINWPAQVVKNPTHYLSVNGSFDSSVRYVAKYPGYAGNSLRVSVCDTNTQYSSIITLAPNSQFNVASSVLSGVVGSNVLTVTIAAANTSNAAQNATVNAYAVVVANQLSNGDQVQVGNGGIGFQFLKVASQGAVTNTANVFSFTLTTTDIFKLSANVASQNSISRFWEFYNLFDRAPGQSQWQLTNGNTSAQDELHAVVVDQLGVFMNTPSLILETYGHMSRGTNSIQIDGGTNYYKEIVNKSSKYIWWATDRSTAVSNTSSLIASGTSTNPLNMTLYGGGDGQDETSVPLSALTNSYSFFQSTEDITVSLILQGKARGLIGTSNTDLGNWLIDNVAGLRKDCVAFVSPEKNLVVNNIGFEASSLITARNSFMRNSSYGFLDSGYKYQYDRWNDLYRWIPLNGDIAGLAARTDQQRAPWWSIAGFNRGQIQNIIRLPFNPKQTERDALYSAGINPVVTFQGQGTVLYGDKTMLTQPSAFNRINVRRLFIVLEVAIKLASQFTLFEFNDDFTRAQFKAMVNPYLQNVKGQRGIYDFLVVCDTTNNTPDVIDANQFVGDIYIKPARSINFIQLNFIAVKTGVAFNEIVGQFGGSS